MAWLLLGGASAMPAMADRRNSDRSKPLRETFRRPTSSALCGERNRDATTHYNGQCSAWNAGNIRPVLPRRRILLYVGTHKRAMEIAFYARRHHPKGARGRVWHGEAMVTRSAAIVPCCGLARDAFAPHNPCRKDKAEAQRMSESGQGIYAL